MVDEFPADMLHDPENRKTQPEYSAFNPEIDKKYPIDKMLSSENIIDASKGLTSMDWVSILRGSPAKNAEAEIMMGQFITLAARAGQWVDMPPIPDKDIHSVSIGNIEVDMRGVKFDFKEGEIILKKIGFIKTIIDDDGRKMIKPQIPMMEYFKERIQKRFGPEDQRGK